MYLKHRVLLDIDFTLEEFFELEIQYLLEEILEAKDVWLYRKLNDRDYSTAYQEDWALGHLPTGHIVGYVHLSLMKPGGLMTILVSVDEDVLREARERLVEIDFNLKEEKDLKKVTHVGTLVRVPAENDRVGKVVSREYDRSAGSWSLTIEGFDFCYYEDEVVPVDSKA